MQDTAPAAPNSSNTSVPLSVISSAAALILTMQAQGFANYVREWWHYSYGDRYWAWMNGQPRAIYGPVPRPA